MKTGALRLAARTDWRRGGGFDNERCWKFGRKVWLYYSAEFEMIDDAEAATDYAFIAQRVDEDGGAPCWALPPGWYLCTWVDLHNGSTLYHRTRITRARARELFKSATGR